MEIDLIKMFEIQRQLDNKIVEKHPLQAGENRLRKKVLAALSEVGECINEFPEIFKFWSNKKNNKEKGLVELVDILHFLLSIGLEEQIKFVELKPLNASYDLADCATSLCFEISCIEFVEESYAKSIARFMELSEMLGFTWEEIESAYMNKNAINWQRQESGY